MAERRAARRAENRADILDAAERVFAEFGIEGGSVRKIGAASGFSGAAVYTFFENKQDLVVATLVRRAEELVSGMREVAAGQPQPLQGLHQIIDATVDFFTARRTFGQVLRRMRGGVQLAGPALTEYQGDGDLTLFHEATTIITAFISAGQDDGTIRSGDPAALAHLFEVLINEFVSADEAGGRLTQDELHGFIDGALRAK
jgi:AcrR family transcriptional regulator